MEKTTDPFQGLCDYTKRIHDINFSLSLHSKYIFKFLHELMMIGHVQQAHHPIFFSTVVSFGVFSPSKFTY